MWNSSSEKQYELKQDTHDEQANNLKETHTREMLNEKKSCGLKCAGNLKYQQKSKR